MRHARIQSILFIALFLLAGALWLWGINDPYVGLYNTNNNNLSLASKNFIRFGLIPLKFLPTYFPSYPLPSHIDYYLHHPPLFFLMAQIPFRIFGFQNWVVHAATGFFAVCSLYILYLIGRNVWGKQVGLWAVVLAGLFPIASFFWKFMFFEQISLFFTLWIFYLFLCYLEKPHRIILFQIGFLSIISILTDWYGAYLLFALPVFYFVKKYRNLFLQTYGVYCLFIAIGLTAFCAVVLYINGNFVQLVGVISNRTVTDELFGLSYPFVRYSIVLILRTILYFTPVTLIVGIYSVYRLVSSKKISLTKSHLVLISFFILGCLNVLVLPTATWGHSYFLYYFLPFFAYSEAIILLKVKNKPILFYGILIIVCVSSILVNNEKMEQVKKQLWKYTVAELVSQKLTQYEEIGVSNFAGDIFENYFFHPTHSIPFALWSEWLQSHTYANTRYLLFTCSGDCTEGELSEINTIQKYTTIHTYSIGNNRAWLVEKKSGGNNQPMIEIEEKPDLGSSSNVPIKPNTNSILFWYRSVRDFLGVGQI